MEVYVRIRDVCGSIHFAKYILLFILYYYAPTFFQFTIAPEYSKPSISGPITLRRFARLFNVKQLGKYSLKF